MNTSVNIVDTVHASGFLLTQFHDLVERPILVRLKLGVHFMLRLKQALQFGQLCFASFQLAVLVFKLPVPVPELALKG